MATHLADKAYDVATNGGKVFPIDTGGRVRVAYDKLTIGSGGIPDSVAVGSLIRFCGAGIPEGARVLYATIQIEDLASSAEALVSIELMDADENGSGIHLTFSGIFELPVTETNAMLSVTDASGDNPSLVTSGPVFPVATVIDQPFNQIGANWAMAVFYVLD